MAKKSKSSNLWLKEHFDDPYVKRSWKDGYRSRAAYKIIELQDKYHFLKPGQFVVDLGAAPGSWCQAARRYIGKNGTLVALDLLPIAPIEKVTILQGDFTEDATLQELACHLRQNDTPGVDVVLSDMAPNMSGSRTADQAQAMYLLELAFDFAQTYLKPGGAFVTKVFQGRDLDTLILAAKKAFKTVHFCKPDASRDRSAEHFLVCIGLQDNPPADQNSFPLAREI